jgi:hypothetical protein
MERLLLSAGRAGSPPPGARERAIVAATAVVATTALASSSAAAGTGIVKSASTLSLRWLVVVGVAGVGAVGVGVLHFAPRSENPVMVAPAPLPQAPPPVQTAALAPPPMPVDPTEPSLPAPSAAPSSGPSAPASVNHAVSADAPAGSAMRDELSWLEGARAAIGSGNPAGALSLLDRYAARFPHGAMGPEATVLRIEALRDAGDRPAAERAAAAFLAAEPRSPYAARVRSLLGQSNP